APHRAQRVDADAERDPVTLVLVAVGEDVLVVHPIEPSATRLDGGGHAQLEPGPELGELAPRTRPRHSLDQIVAAAVDLDRRQASRGPMAPEKSRVRRSALL